MIRANDKGLASTPAVVDEPPKPGLVNGRNIIILVGIVAWVAVLLLFIVPNLTRKPAQTLPQASTAAEAVAPAKPAAAAAGAPAAAGVAPKAVALPELDITN